MNIVEAIKSGKKFRSKSWTANCVFYQKDGALYSLFSLDNKIEWLDVTDDIVISGNPEDYCDLIDFSDLLKDDYYFIDKKSLYVIQEVQPGTWGEQEFVFGEEEAWDFLKEKEEECPEKTYMLFKFSDIKNRNKKMNAK